MTHSSPASIFHSAIPRQTLVSDDSLDSTPGTGIATDISSLIPSASSDNSRSSTDEEFWDASEWADQSVEESSLHSSLAPPPLAIRPSIHSTTAATQDHDMQANDPLFDRLYQQTKEDSKGHYGDVSFGEGSSGDETSRTLVDDIMERKRVSFADDDSRAHKFGTSRESRRTAATSIKSSWKGDKTTYSSPSRTTSILRTFANGVRSFASTASNYIRPIAESAWNQSSAYLGPSLRNAWNQSSAYLRPRLQNAWEKSTNIVPPRSAAWSVYDRAQSTMSGWTNGARNRWAGRIHGQGRANEDTGASATSFRPCLTNDPHSHPAARH